MDKYNTYIPYIDAQNLEEETLLKQVLRCEMEGATQLILSNPCEDEEDKEGFLFLVKQVIKQVNVPVNIGMKVCRFEEIKKALYTGAKQVIITLSTTNEYEYVKEGVARFGKERILIERESISQLSDENFLALVKELGVGGVVLDHAVLETESIPQVSCALIGYERVNSEVGEEKNTKNVLESFVPFSSFKLNGDGLLPVVVQDYKSQQVLMVAYMNEEAFTQTIKTRKMTYYSRSREELWVKGATSSHYQYVKALTIDCDNDTILAKVEQIGAACHTGNLSCFYTELIPKAYEEGNPLNVLEDVYRIILDRKENPKEGSYTNYLFDKGIDKILKKCGEEATEIVIAAKNPDQEELKYEISDFLYHMMVLMVECDVDWNDIIGELAHRR